MSVNGIPSRSDIARSAKPCLAPRKLPERRAAWGEMPPMIWRAGRDTENGRPVIKLYMVSKVKIYHRILRQINGFDFCTIRQMNRDPMAPRAMAANLSIMTG